MTANDTILPLTEKVAPAEQAAVAGAVRGAFRSGTPVYPIGGGTALDYGLRPCRPGLGLSLAGLDRVVDHPAADMTITVEAGVTVAELGRRLAAAGQRLPLDVPRAGWATIGGVVATNTAGPRRYAHGTVREYLIGLSAVDGRGAVFCGGGRVVKNAAGYDLCRMMAGSLGTLGVITQVTLMVRPLPETLAIVACDLPDLDTAERLLAELVQTETVPAAVELQAGAARQDNPVLGPMLQSDAARLMVGFEGTAAEVEWMVGRLRGEWRSSGATSLMTVPAAEAGVLWNWLTGFAADLRINVLPGATVAMIESLLRLDPDASILAHAGNGVIGVGLSAASLKQITSVLRDKLRPAVASAGGTMVVLSCSHAAELTGADVWGPPGDGATVIRAIKDRFDPHDLLNPGRFVYQD